MKKSTKAFLKKNIWIILFYIFIITVIIIYYAFFHASKKYEVVESLANLPDPIQTPISKEFTKSVVTGEHVKEDLKFTCLYDFDIYGRVVNVQDYYGFADFSDAISKRDVTLVFGPFNDDSVLKNVTFGSSANRVVYFNINSKQYRDFKNNQLRKYFANIHTIYSNQKIKKLLEMIKVNDYVRLKGYLVNVDSINGRGYWHTNILKDDNDELYLNHQCQILYVTDVIWLKEK